MAGSALKNWEWSVSREAFWRFDHGLSSISMLRRIWNKPICRKEADDTREQTWDKNWGLLPFSSSSSWTYLGAIALNVAEVWAASAVSGQCYYLFCLVKIDFYYLQSKRASEASVGCGLTSYPRCLIASGPVRREGRVVFADQPSTAHCQLAKMCGQHIIGDYRFWSIWGSIFKGSSKGILRTNYSYLKYVNGSRKQLQKQNIHVVFPITWQLKKGKNRS